MDQSNNTSLPATPKAKRRRHPPEFRAKIVELTQRRNASIAAIAQQYNLNANLVHKWRRSAQEASSFPSDSSAFLPIPMSPAAHPAARVHFELDGLRVEWPLAHIDQALPWLKALRS